MRFLVECVMVFWLGAGKYYPKKELPWSLQVDFRVQRPSRARVDLARYHILVSQALGVPDACAML